MKILLVVRWPSGGIRTYLRYVFSHDSLVDHEYRLLTPYGDNLEFVTGVFPHERFRHVVSENGTLRFAQAASREIRRWKPDLIHSHGFTSGVVSAPAARMTRTTHLLTSHDVLSERQFPGLAGRFRRAGVSLALGSINHVMAVGEDALANMLDFFPGLRGKASSIRNGIDVGPFLGEVRRDLKSELGVPQNTLLLGFFGRFMAQKGFGLLVDAVERVCQAGMDLRVACFGWGGFIREEQEMLRRRRLSELFHFLPHTDDMPAALRGVDAVVMPSRWEACPLLPMEALVAGAPVIASDCIGMREVVRDTPALVFPSENVEALAECITDVAHRRDELRIAAGAFREEAARRFDSANAARGLAELYRRLDPAQGRD